MQNFLYHFEYMIRYGMIYSNYFGFIDRRGPSECVSHLATAQSRQQRTTETTAHLIQLVSDNSIYINWPQISHRFARQFKLYDPQITKQYFYTYASLDQNHCLLASNKFNFWPTQICFNSIIALFSNIFIIQRVMAVHTLRI